MRTHLASVNALTSLLAALALLTTFVEQTHAQSRPALDAVETIGSCVAIQTNVTTVETPTGLQAVGSCETAQGSPCTLEIVPTGPDIILDVNDNTGIPQCKRVIGNDPCATVSNGPLIFQSERHATQAFTASSDQARMTTKIGQKKVQQTFLDLAPSARFPLNVGRSFDVLRNHSSASARLECSMADGDQRIFPIVGQTDPSSNIRFVSKNSSEPSFDVLTYLVTP